MENKIDIKQFLYLRKYMSGQYFEIQTNSIKNEVKIFHEDKYFKCFGLLVFVVLMTSLALDDINKFKSPNLIWSVLFITFYILLSFLSFISAIKILFPQKIILSSEKIILKNGHWIFGITKIIPITEIQKVEIVEKLQSMKFNSYITRFILFDCGKRKFKIGGYLTEQDALKILNGPLKDLKSPIGDQ